MADRLDTPLASRNRLWHRLRRDPDAVGRYSEGVARFFGTPTFIIWLTVFVVVWLGWNTFGPEPLRFDSAALGFTALTLMLSLQASYSSPLILLAQNRQVDRDRVSAEQDRQRAERNLADTEYLTREIASLRLAMSDVATRDFVRSELRDLLKDIVDERDARISELEAELAAWTLERDRAADDDGPADPAGPHPGDQGDAATLDTHPPRHS